MSPLTLLFILAFLVSVDLRILAPVLPSISLSLKSSPGTIGLAMTTYSLAYGFGQLFYGPLSDRLGRIAVVRTAGVGFSICTILSAISVTPWQFIIARLLAGTFAGAVIPLTLVYIADTVEYSRRQSIIGLYSVVNSAAMAFSAGIGGTIAYFISWRFMLLGYGLFALIPIGFMWRIKVHKAIKSATGAERTIDLLRNRYAVFIYVAVFLEGFLLWGGMTYFGSFAAHRYRLDQFTIGLLIALLGVGTMIGGILMNRSKCRISENAMAAVGGVLMGASFLMLIPKWSSVAFGISTFILGLGFVGLHTTLQLLATEISLAARGKAFSLFVCSLFLGIAAGSAAFGWLANGGRYEAMFAIAGFGLIGVGLAMGGVPRNRVRD